MSEKVSMLGVPNNTVDENGIRWRRTRCFMCHMNCGVWCGVDTKTGRLVEMRPNEEEGSVLCNRLGNKGEKAIKFHYHPKRINHCMKRVGEKGEDKWEEISWEQAIDEISTKLMALKEKYGAKTLFSSEGTYRSDHLWARTRFFNLFGNPGNVVDPGTICWCWNYSLNMAMVGWPVEAIMPVSPSYTGTIVNWGKRWSEAYAPEGPLWRTMRGRIEVNQDNPAQYINIDTTCIDGSATADIWLQPYPGTDCAISFAWLNVIFEEKLWDDKFVRYWSNAPFLVRKDTGKLVRLDEFNGGKHEDFLAINEISGQPVTWCSDENRYYEDCEVTPALQGTFKIKMADGSEVECWTAFDAIEDRFKDWTPERASKISNVPARKIREAARLYATNGPAFIGWGLGGGDQHGINASQFGIAKTMARILTGNIDNPGGEYVGQPADPDDKEKLFPVLAVFTYDKWEDAVEIARANLNMEGAGHSCVIHSNTKEHIEYVPTRVNVSRYGVNQVGGTGLGGAMDNGLNPTTTLGCGTWGGNSISENIYYHNLMNVSRISYKIKNKKFPTDEEIWAD